MDYKQAFKKECELQTGEKENIRFDDLILLNETTDYWIIKDTGEHDDQREILSVVWKNNRRMESIEL